jgi:asparagine N-glycosylation enzyme membrane subunit Stt3
MCLA